MQKCLKNEKKNSFLPFCEEVLGRRRGAFHLLLVLQTGPFGEKPDVSYLLGFFC